MSKRMTIAVPEALHERLQPFKNQLNISALCQEALDMAIRQEEIKQQAATDECLIARLQAEKQILINHIHQEGYELGLRSASHLSYKDFRHFERVRPLAANFDEDVLDYLWTFLDTKGSPEAIRSLDPDMTHLFAVSDQSRILFCQGWLDGVLHVWDLIKDQVESDS
ncbi:MAG: hypothetical protein VKJ64_05095 [Leptolyngbyaceae bacterium]|nr:hypothetical protein [Leptolyngbyaceae bacterium]